jgi:hypothetical protein
VVRILFVVAGANKVAGVAFAQELRQRAAGEDRAIIQMRRDERQDLSAMRLVGVGSLDDHLLRSPAQSFSSATTRQSCCRNLQKFPTPHKTSRSSLEIKGSRER